MTRVSAGVDRSPVLVDAALDEAFRRDGYVVGPLLPPAGLDALRGAVEGLVPADGGPFFGLYRNDEPGIRRHLDTAVRVHLEPLVDDLLRDHRIYIGSVLVKYAGGGTHLALHQDWSFVDEERFVSGAVWVPLSDVDDRNGGLRVVPGSHRYDVPYRGTPAAVDLDAVVDPDQVVDVPVPAGHALTYHNALIHGSTENRSDRPRMVAVLGFVSSEAPMVHFHVDESGQRWRYQVRDERAFEYRPPAAPSGPTVVTVEAWDSRPYSVDRRMLARPTG